MSDPQNAVRTIKLGDNEFGESYHCAVAMLLYNRISFLVTGKTSRVAQFKAFLEDVGKFSDTLNAQDRPISHVAEHPYGLDPENVKAVRDIIIKNWNCANAAAWQRGMIKLRSITQMACLDTTTPKVLIWIRNQEYDAYRNSPVSLLVKLKQIVEEEVKAQAVFIGDSLSGIFQQGTGLIEFYKDDAFSGKDGMMEQLNVFRMLKDHYKVVGSIGMMSGGMDGPTMLVGIPAISLVNEKKRQSKILKYDGIVDGFHTVIIPGDNQLLDDQRAKVISIMSGWMAGNEE